METEARVAHTESLMFGDIRVRLFRGTNL